MIRIISVSSLLFLAFLSTLHAGTDKKGSQDHPLVSRYKDTFIKGYTLVDYDKFDYATGPIVPGQPKPPIKTVEGKITTILYETNSKSESVIKVFRNYEDSFKKAGIKKIFSCENKQCGPKFIPRLMGDSPRSGAYLGVDPWNMGGRFSNFVYWVGQLNQGGKTIYVSLTVDGKTYGNWPIEVGLDIVETKKMELGLVSINLNSLTSDINTNGKAVLEGIFFDHDKDIVKPKSKSSMDVIAKYLKKYPKQNVFIVGHTDTSGSLLHNIGLSNRRANAVVEYLVSHYRINKQRMSSHGVGPVAPVTSNTTDVGRARNRRVEIVLDTRTR